MSHISPSETSALLPTLKGNTRKILDHLHATGRPVHSNGQGQGRFRAAGCARLRNTCRQGIWQNSSPRLNGRWKAPDPSARDFLREFNRAKKIQGYTNEAAEADVPKFWGLHCPRTNPMRQPPYSCAWKSRSAR